MRFDTILTPSDSFRILDEIVAMRSHSSVRAKGISQSGATHHQFLAELDAPAEAWHMVTDTDKVFSSADGTATLQPNPPRQAAFLGSMPHPIQMLHPEALRFWGRPHESFYPVLAQTIGNHSILLTFEHLKDAAFRTTAVVNSTTGIVEKTMQLGDVTILTEIGFDQPLMRRRDIQFVPITDWIRPNY